MPYHVRIVTKSNSYNDEVTLDLTEQELRQRFVAPYDEGSAIVTEGRTITPSDVHRISIMHTDAELKLLLPLASHLRPTVWDESVSSGPWGLVQTARNRKDVTDEFIMGPPGNLIDKIEEKERKRFQFLHKLCDIVGGDELEKVFTSEVGEQLGFDRVLARKIAESLQSAKLIEVPHRKTYDDWLIRITSSGIREVKTALSERDKPTEHFPPVNLIYVDGNIVGSPIQQASPGATQAVTVSKDEREEIWAVVQSLKSAMGDLRSQIQEMADLSAEIQTMEAQMTSSKPKRAVMIESLRSVKGILEGATGSLIAYELLNKVAPLLQQVLQ